MEYSETGQIMLKLTEKIITQMLKYKDSLSDELLLKEQEDESYVEAKKLLSVCFSTAIEHVFLASAIQTSIVDPAFNLQELLNSLSKDVFPELIKQWKQQIATDPLPIGGYSVQKESIKDMVKQAIDQQNSIKQK